jgi:hypothetical protein
MTRCCHAFGGANLRKCSLASRSGSDVRVWWNTACARFEDRADGSAA